MVKSIDMYKELKGNTCNLFNQTIYHILNPLSLNPLFYKSGEKGLEYKVENFTENGSSYCTGRKIRSSVKHKHGSVLANTLENIPASIKLLQVRN